MRKPEAKTPAAKSKAMTNREVTFMLHPANELGTKMKNTMSQKPHSHCIRNTHTLHATTETTENKEKRTQEETEKEATKHQNMATTTPHNNMGQEVRPHHHQRNQQPAQPRQLGKESTSNECTMEKQNNLPTQLHWGDEMQQKDAATIWLLVQNIGGIDMMESGSIKLAALRNFTNKHQIDICALTKCNTDWTKAPAHLHKCDTGGKAISGAYHTTPKKPMR